MAVPEIELILCYSRLELDGRITDRLKNIVSAPLDWERIIWLAKYHRVASLIYRNIKDSDFLREIIPEHILLQLKEYYYAVIKKNTLLWEEFRRIQDNFRKESVEIIPLKGIILNHSLYNNIGLRPIVCDMDILVREKDLAIAADVLKKMGYIQNYSDYGFHTVFRKNESIIELHWLLVTNWLNTIDTNALFQRAKACDINGVNVKTLPQEDTLLSLLVQIRYELAGFGLFRLCDINEIITRHSSSFDWDYLLKTAKKYQLQNALSFSLAALSSLFYTSIPRGVMTSLSSKSLKRKILLNLPEERLKKLLIEDLPLKKGKLSVWLLKILMTDRLEATLKIFMHNLKKLPGKKQ